MIKAYLLLATFLLLNACIKQEGVTVSQSCAEADNCKAAIFDPTTSYCVKNRLAERYDELDGNGTPSNPYIICSTAQFIDLGKRNSGWSKSFLLAQDIDLNQYYIDGGEKFQIGSCGQTNCRDFGPGHIQYSGTFDGAGFTIAGFQYEIETSEAGASIFGSIGSAGVVANLEIVGASIEGNDAMAVVAGRNDGVVSNVKVLNSSVDLKPGNTTPENVAGVVGINRGVMRYIEVDKTSATILDDAASTFTNVGGVVGLNDNNAFLGNIVNKSRISLTNGNVVGGIAGYNNGTITLSKNIASIEITTGNSVGGLTGKMANLGQIAKSYNTGNTTGNITNHGGLVGEITFPTFGDIQASEEESRGIVINSYNIGNVSSTGDNVGGIIGHNRGQIQSSYFRGLLSGGDYVGGIAGKNDFVISQNFVHGSTINGDTSSITGVIFGGSSAADATFIATDDEKGNGIDPSPIFQQNTETLSTVEHPWNAFSDIVATGIFSHAGVEGNGVGDYFNLNYELFSDSYLLTCPNPLPKNVTCSPTTQNVIHWDFSTIWIRKSGSTPELGF